MQGDKITVGKEAIELIQATAVKASRSEEICFAGGPDHVRYIARPDGAVEPIMMDPRPRKYSVCTLASFIALAKAAGEQKHGGVEPVVWVDRERVTLCLDDATRRDYATLTLTMTVPHELLSEGSSSQARNQHEFREMLRIELNGTLPGDSNLVKIISDLKFDQGNLRTGVIDHAKESMGAEITASVTGKDKIVEEIKLGVRLFDVSDLTAKRQIRCAISINPTDQEFRLIPFPQEVENAVDEEIGKIADSLAEALNCPVYRGSL